MMNILRVLTLIVLAGTLAACGSTPQSDYYMLTANATGVPTGSSPRLGVGPVTIPDYLETRKIVTNRNAHLLKLAEYDRWAEPLDAGVTRVVAVNLASLMNTGSVAIFPWRRDSIPEYAVRVAVVQFAAQGKEALLVAEWAITRPAEGKSLAGGITQLTAVLAGGEPEHVAAAYSDLLLQFSQQVAEALKEIEAQAGAEA